MSQNRLRMWQYLAQQRCIDCGEQDPVVLEFDHMRDKRRNIAELISGGLTWAVIQAEIEKCEVRCANCHRRKTARERGFYERKANALIVGGSVPSALLWRSPKGRLGSA